MNAKLDEFRGSFGRKLLPALGLFLTGAVTVVFGIGLARLIVTPDYGWAMTITGVSFYLLAIAANPLLGFLIWIVTTPFSRFYFLDILMGRGIPDLTLTRVCAAFITMFLAAQVATRSRRIPRINKVDVVMVFFCLGLLVSAPMAVNGPRNAIVHFTDGYVIPFLIYLFARMLVLDRKGLRSVLVALFVVGGYLSVIAVREQLTGEILFWFRDSSWYYQGGVRKLSGLLGNPAHFGTILGMIVPFTIRSVLNSETPSKRVFGAVLAALEIWAIYLTYNRGSWLGFVLSMLFMLAFYPRFRRLALPLFLIAVVVAALSWSAISSSAVFQERLGAQIQVTYRLAVYQLVGKIIQGDYLFGLGLGGYDVAYLRVVKGIYGDSPWPARMMPHNAFLYILFVAGVVALIPFTLVFLFMIWDGYVLWRRAQEGDIWIDPDLIVCFGAALIVYLTQSMVIDMMASFYPNMIFFVIMGVMYGIRDALPAERKAEESGEQVEVHIP